MRATTQSTRQKSAMDITRLEIKNALGWDELRLSQFVEAMAYQYLTIEYGEEMPLIQEVPKSATFWAWWRNHWQKRDREFLAELPLLFADEIEGHYRKSHSPGSILWRPHRVILEQTYLEMIHRLVAEQTRGGENDD